MPYGNVGEISKSKSVMKTPYGSPNFSNRVASLGQTDQTFKIVKE